MKQYFERYPILISAVYFPIYLFWFSWLQGRSIPRDWMYSRLDSLIPFCSWFIIPYLMWFFFVAGTVLFLLSRSQEDYLRLCVTLYGGMTICLIIYTFLPNGQLLRPTDMPDDGLLTRLTFLLYDCDPSINSCPSIHVLNTLLCQDALMRSDALRGRWQIKTAAGVLSGLIVLATMFLKQHSVIDVTAAIALFLALDALVYRKEPHHRHVSRRRLQKSFS